MSYSISLITTNNFDEAKKISRILVEQKLVACVNIIDKINSIYWWQGEVVEDSEVLLLAKTETKFCDEIIKTVKANHSYSVPEIIFVPIIDGSKDYFDWITSNVTKLN